MLIKNHKLIKNNYIILINLIIILISIVINLKILFLGYINCIVAPLFIYMNEENIVKATFINNIIYVSLCSVIATIDCLTKLNYFNIRLAAIFILLFLVLSVSSVACCFFSYGVIKILNKLRSKTLKI